MVPPPVQGGTALVARRLAAFWLVFAVAGCAPGIGVREVAHLDPFAGWRASAVHDGSLSQRTVQTLRQLNLADQFAEHPEQVQSQLHQAALKDNQADTLFALAEINYLLGRRAEEAGQPDAVVRYYLCAGYAYHFLFRSRDGNKSWWDNGDARMPVNAYDPRHRLACDFYNAGLAKCIRAAQQVGRLDPRRDLHLPTTAGDFTLSVDHVAFPWQPEEFGPLLFCTDYKVVGLDNQYRTFGLGVPLIGIRTAAAKAAPGQAFYPKEVSFPVTAFFRFDCELAELGNCRAGKLELYNPLRVQRVQVSGQQVPLETDLTTPLAYFLSKTDLEGVSLRGFFRPDRVRNKAGIYLFEPYEPGKIPVLLTHGLLSSPLTWTRMYNDLRADPVLRDNYQFWFFLYPTGNPYLATAADLRQQLAELRGAIDPQRRDRALDDMVLVGHSMGGLVNKLLSLDSGDDFWRLVSKEPFQQVKGSAESLGELQRVFYFDRQPAVQRVVFIGTPHRGSKLSEPAGFLLDRFLQLPRNLMDATAELVRDNPDVLVTAGKPEAARLPTTLDLLTPNSPALEVMARRGPGPGVHYHSIIGVTSGQGTNSSDGVVAYASSHIDAAESEVLVPAGHSSLHDHPRSVLEVRRILHEHLKEARQREILLTGAGQTR
jgi:pimeloyl-ACP methyl ester carboxylesterase